MTLHDMTMTNHDDPSIDFFPPNRSRKIRRLHKGKNSHEKISDNDKDADLEAEEEEPLVQSLTAMASHLIDDESLENSSEKDVFIHEGNSGPQDQSDDPEVETQNAQDGEPEHSDIDLELETEEEINQDSPKSEGNQILKPTAESKTLTTLTLVGPNPSSWFDDNNNNHRSSTTPKGLTTWSAVNGAMQQQNSGFKGTVQKMPSDYTVSGMLAFNQQSSLGTTNKPITTASILTKESAGPTQSSPTTEASRTTKVNTGNTTPNRRKKPATTYNRYKPKKTGVLPSKFVKPPLEDVISVPIASDDTHTTYQLVTNPETKSTHDYLANKYTKKPYPWPINNPTTVRSANKKPPFSRITKKPYGMGYLKNTKNPMLTLTTPTTTTPSTTTVYLRNPGPLIQAFPISLTNMPFLDFIRSQVFPRIGLSLLSFMATSPLLLTLLGAGAAAGRRKRDLDSIKPQTNEKTIPNFLTPMQIVKLISGAESKYANLNQQKQSPSTRLPTISFTTTFTNLLQRLYNANKKVEANVNPSHRKR